MEGCDEQTSHRSPSTSRRRSRVASVQASQLHDPPAGIVRGVWHMDERLIYFLQQERCPSPRSSGGEAMTHAMRSASLASELAASAVDREAIGEVVAVNGEIASVDGLDDLIETIPRLALMVSSATAAELMEVESDGTLKLLSRSGAGVETTTCSRMQIPLGQSGRNLVLIVWA